ncbi:nucleoside recognition domain-containing protein [Romboutsia sp. 13368]|uniref:nucleoside recognition domain-containing protein n=1 Tax=Romboutsia sp. 13368 TaxID=2708053 RepID=UPI0025D65603|nr:nucleoside recognition domain-containing protein [Romboutsia sp. 13368]
MENTSNEIKLKDINIDNFFEKTKIAIYSLIGIIVFFIPININNQTKTILHHIAYNLQINYRGFLQICTIVYLIIGVVKSIISSHKNKLTKAYSYLRIFSIFITISIFYNNNSIILLDDNVSLILEETILNLVTVLPLSAIFIAFILDFGLLDIVEAYCHKFMKKTFKLSGKCVLNIIMYIFNDCFCGYFMTNLLYQKGRIRQNEACIIILNFSIASISVINYVSDEFNLNKMNFLILSVFILTLTNIISCRLYPINKKKKSYYIKTNYKETYFKTDKLNKSINKYIENKEDINIFKLIIINLEQSILIIIHLIPNLVLVIYLVDIIMKNIDVIYNLKIIFSNILEVLKFNNIDDISIFIVNGLFNDVIAIESLNKNIEYTSKLLVGIICVLKCTSLSTNIIYLHNTNIPIKKIDFFISYIQRIIVMLLISAMIFYLYNIYTI